MSVCVCVRVLYITPALRNYIASFISFNVLVLFNTSLEKAETNVSVKHHSPVGSYHDRTIYIYLLGYIFFLKEIQIYEE